MTGVIIVPTLNRPALLHNFIKSCEETKTDIQIRFLVDDVDYHNNKDAYEAVEALFTPNMRLIKTGTAVSMADKTKYIWSHIQEYKWVGLLNDDHYCLTRHWDLLIEGMMDGTNMVSTNDGFWNFGFRVVGLTAWSTALLESCGFPIFPRGLQHLYIDDVWKAIGESTGCWHETMRVNIEHRHTFINKMEADDTFRKVNDPLAYQKDLKEFTEFMEQDFKAVCERVLALRSGQVHSNKFV